MFLHSMGNCYFWFCLVKLPRLPIVWATNEHRLYFVIHFEFQNFRLAQHSQPPIAPIVHPKLILAAAVFFARRGSFPRLPECARPRAQQRGKADRHRFGQSASPFVCAISKAPEGWRTPRRFAHIRPLRISARFWTAAALCRFSTARPSQTEYQKRAMTISNCGERDQSVSA